MVQHVGHGCVIVFGIALPTLGPQVSAAAPSPDDFVNRSVAPDRLIVSDRGEWHQPLQTRPPKGADDPRVTAERSFRRPQRVHARSAIAKTLHDGTTDAVESCVEFRRPIVGTFVALRCELAVVLGIHRRYRCNVERVCRSNQVLRQRPLRSQPVRSRARGAGQSARHRPRSRRDRGRHDRTR